MEKLEIKRKIFHILAGLLFVGLIFYDILTPVVLIIVLIAEFVIFFILKKHKIPFIYPFLTMMERPKDLKKFPGKGSIYYTLGVFLAVVLFPKDIAMASVIILALGDAFASLVGWYGKIKNPLSKERKTIEGSVAGIVIGFLGALMFVMWLEALVGTVAAMIVESFNLKVGHHEIDDNLTMPLVAGAVIWLLRIIL